MTTRSFTTRALITSAVVGIFLISMPVPRAHAVVLPVLETNPAIISGVTATAGASTVTAGNASIQTLILNQLNGLAWTVAKVAVKSITRSTVNWINSGFQGSPAFVTDLQANLNALSDTVANNFFQQINRVTTDVTGFNLVSPFQDQISAQLRSNYYKATGSLLGLNQYNLQGQSSNPQAFLNGNFRQGGFNAFFSASQNPANNPFGAYMIASNALFDQIDTAAKQRRDEITGGKGFLSFRKKCTTSNPAGVTQTGGTNGTPPVALAKTDTTYNCPISTPGSVIEAQLENSLGSGVRQLELADSINEIVGALAGQLVNQVLGPNGLFGTSQPSSAGGSSYIDQVGGQSAASQNASLTQGVIQNIATDLLTLATFRDHWQEILDAANDAQQACGVRSDISAVIAQATTQVARGNTAIQQETALKSAFTSASVSTAADASTQLTAVVTQYQTFLSASTTPSYTDQAYATAQSANTTIDGSDASSTPSLYSQMVTERNKCSPGN